jgi:hypothetical protein
MESLSRAMMLRASSSTRCSGTARQHRANNNNNNNTTTTTTIRRASSFSRSSSLFVGEKNRFRHRRRKEERARDNTTTVVVARMSGGGGFLEDALERVKQKSAEIEEAVQSVVSSSSSLFKKKESAAKNVEDMKADLLRKIETVERGANASEEDKEEIDALAQRVENTQKRKNALETEYINGKWELMYTTSSSILGLTKPKLLRPSGPIYQTIDAKNLRAFNSESAPFYNQVSAELTPTSKSSVDVQFKKFGLFNGLIKINAPESAKGKLDTTFVDEDLRISRGDKGNLFVLLMRDRSATLDEEY